MLRPDDDSVQIQSDGEEDQKTGLPRSGSSSLVAVGDETVIAPAAAATATAAVAATRRSDVQADGPSLLASALQQLSDEDRQSAYDDIHGVPQQQQQVKETPHLLASSLLKMEEDIEKLLLAPPPELDTEAYQQADPAYTKNDNFRLHFLRAEDFQTCKAAERLLRFIEFKQWLFGSGKVCHQISFSDLTVEDRKLLNKGHFQLLPERDTAGRVVGVLFPGGDAGMSGADSSSQSLKCLGRVWLYSSCFPPTNGGASSSISQMVAIIVHPQGKSDVRMDEDLARLLKRIHGSICIRLMIQHHCVESPTTGAFRSFLGVFLEDMTVMTRARVRIHSGKSSQWMDDLKTFGLPVRRFPLTTNDNIKLRSHVEFIHMKRAMETQYADQLRQQREATASAGGVAAGLLEQQQQTTYYMIPKRTDVLMGKGRPTHEHHGNMVLQNLVDEHLDEYGEQGNDPDKRLALFSSLVGTIQRDCGGQFLSKEQSGIWSSIDDLQATQKVSRMFRVRARVRNNTDS